MNKTHVLQNQTGQSVRESFGDPSLTGMKTAEAVLPNDLLLQLSWAAEMCDCLGWSEAKRYILFMRKGLEQGEP